jgi:hypothetical protein
MGLPLELRIDFIGAVHPRKQTIRLTTTVLLFCSISCFADDVLCPNDESDDSKQLAISFTTEYDSKYIFRGVNSLPGSGIATTAAEFDYCHFSLEVWQATGISKSYDELDFTLGYKYEKGPVTVSVGYVNYYTPNDDHLQLGYNDTQEFFVSAEYDICSRYTATLNYNYDFDKIRGGFIEPKFAASFLWSQCSMQFDPYVSITYDLQYNSDRFAWNNFQTGIEISRKMNEHVKLNATAEVSVPLVAIKQFAKKEGWIGLGFTADF